jgi:1-aminocyclopropane-1-carboxylate deaminase/D-cysteine desulfhydrase-like pyridoxal-dependent ACC family enzyme
MVTLVVKREDLIHPWVSGNKWRKLKYNLNHCIDEGFPGIITFGGAYSNHLYAVAGACHLLGLKSIGIVRGEIGLSNPTLNFCHRMGMKLISSPRSEYRHKNASPIIQDILNQYHEYYVVPEGGTNYLALEGVKEIHEELDTQLSYRPDYIICACGTGGTAAGLCLTDHHQSHIIAISALKTKHLGGEIQHLLNGFKHAPYTVIYDYHFGGYAKYNQSLLSQIELLEKDYKLPLDHVYNGKAFIGLLDLIGKNYFPPNSNIVYLHTGGLQGKLNE